MGDRTNKYVITCFWILNKMLFKSNHAAAHINVLIKRFLKIPSNLKIE